MNSQKLYHINNIIDDLYQRGYAAGYNDSVQQHDALLSLLNEYKRLKERDDERCKP